MINRSRFINLLRWVSALLVVIGHIRSILFVDFTDIVNPTLFLQGFYLITSLGHEAVMVFFMISGYLVGGGIIKQLKSSAFNINVYSFNRITRLYIVLPAALVITFLFDKIGIGIDKTLYVSNGVISSLGYDITARLDIKHFVSSLMMFQNIYLPAFGSNGPLWSLSYEFWYYILAGIGGLSLSFLLSKRLISGGVCFIVLIFTAQWLPPVYLKYFIIWLLGCCIFLIKTDSKFPVSVFYILCSVLFGFIIAYKSNVITFMDPFYKDLFIAVILALIIGTVPDNKKISKDIHYRLSSFSYTLYLIHYPVGLCLLVILNTYTSFGIKEPPSLLSFACFIILTFVIVILCHYISLITEAKTQIIRDKAILWVSKTKPRLKNSPEKI